MCGRHDGFSVRILVYTNEHKPKEVVKIKKKKRKEILTTRKHN